MTSVEIGLIALGCTAGGALAGILIRSVLPRHHLGDDTRNVVNVATGTISVLAALVISSLITSARDNFEAKNGEVQRFAANLSLLDHVMIHYGPETGEARELLRRYTALKIDLTWPKERGHEPALDNPAALEMLETVQDKLRELEPKDEAQRWLRARALQVSGDLAQTRWLLASQVGSVIPRPFLVVLVFWLTVLFGSFGLFAPRNATVVTVLFVCALSASAAVFLILEMEHPFDGIVTISAEPMRSALARMSGR